MKRRPRAKHRIPVPALGAAALAGAAGFATVGTLIRKKKTRRFDAAVRKRVKGTSKSGKAVVQAAGYTGKWWVHAPISAYLAHLVEERTSLDAARAIGLASTTASAAAKALDWLFPHRAPPPGRHAPNEQSFPSGHTLETAAVALATAYVLSREGIVPPAIAYPAALAAPLLQGTGRLYLDRHYATDVLGGLAGGVAIAAACAVGYEIRVARR